jgi:hypothetical protein
MNFFQRRKILKGNNPGDLVPVRAYGHDEVEGKVTILVPKFESRWIHVLFPRTEKLFYRIKLDELGTMVWKNISGEKNISGISRFIIKELAEKTQPYDEMEDRILKFISMLYDRRYITFRQFFNS